MSLATYRRVLALPGVARLLLFAVIARIPLTATGVVLTLHVVTHLHLGYGPAGVVVTAATVGMAIGGPWRGRVIDRDGLRRAIVPSLVAAAVSWGFAPLLGFWPLTVLVLAGGLLTLPVFSVARQSLAVLVPPDSRRTAFALDSIGVELSYAVGPAAGVLVATQVSTGAALLAMGGCLVLAGLVLIAFNPPTRSAPDRSGAEDTGVPAPAGAEPPPRRRQWITPGLLAVLGATAAATLVLSGTDVAIVASLRHAGALPLTGLVFAAWSAGSIAGAAVYGALNRSVSPLLLLLWLSLLTLPVGLATSPTLLIFAILPAGAMCAPVISATADRVSRLVPERSRGEAMGWHGGALTVGSAVGAPIAGAVIDATAPWAGFATVAVLGCLLAGAGLTLERTRRRAARIRPGLDQTGSLVD